LERERDAAAELLRFERAGELHQAITTLRSLQGKRRHLRSASNTTNFLVVVRQPNKPAAQVLAFSAARLRGEIDVQTSPERLTDEQRGALLHFLLEHYPVKRQLAIDLEELDQMDVVAEWLSRQGRQAVYVPLPNRSLTERDATAALDAVERALMGQPAAFDAPARMDMTPAAGAARISQESV